VKAALAELRRYFSEPEIMELAFQVSTFGGWVGWDPPTP
jgi:hypothetical protein